MSKSHIGVDLDLSATVTAGISFSDARDLVLVVSGSLVISDVLEGVFD